MRIGRLSGVVGGLGWVIGLVASVGSAGATTFETPPGIGDRRVALTWQPDADDPVYNGNTVLRVEASIDTLHEQDRALEFLVANGASSQIFSYARGDARIRRWSRAGGVWIEDLPLPEGTSPTSIVVHGSDRRLLAALSDSSLVMWRLDGAGRRPLVMSRGVLSTSIIVPPGIRDTLDLRYVSADVDDTVRVWAEPGRLAGRGYAIGVPGRLSAALAMSNDRALLAVGTVEGEVRVYDVRTPPNTPLLRLTGHVAPIADLSFARDISKLGSADAAGQVRGWRMPSGALIYTEDTGTPPGGAPGPRLSFAPPRGRILAVVRPDGWVELRDGETGVILSELEVLSGRSATAVGFTPDGIRTYVGDSGGGITEVRAGLCLAGPDTPRCFGGYMVWRSPTADPKDAVLLRVYNYSDSTWTFLGTERAFVDPDSVPRRQNPPVPGQDDEPEELRIFGPHNGLPFYYSVTRFDWAYETGGVFPVMAGGTDAVHQGFYRDNPGGPPTAIVAEAGARTQTPLLDRVFVVPDPYEIGRVPWELSGIPHVEFRNLPEAATIRIYTLAGEFVRELRHGRGKYGESSDMTSWDFRNSAGRRVTSGVYIYKVETPAGKGSPGEVQEGYFTVIL